MAEFRKPAPNLIESDEGSIRIHGRAGLPVTYHDETYQVSSEMLAPFMTIALYTRGSDAIASDHADEIVDFVTRGLEFAGFTVEAD